jgi:serine/threonine protein kinase
LYRYTILRPSGAWGPEEFAGMTDEELHQTKMEFEPGSNYWEWANEEQEERRRKAALASRQQRGAFETATNTYTVEDTLGEGGAGVVYRVGDADGRPFALKCLRAAQSAKRRRFRNELWFCQQKQHPNIIEVVDSGVSLQGTVSVPFYVMPLFQRTLRTRMRDGIAYGDVLRLFDQVLSGVEAAHLKGVYHRDLKPENILCDTDGSRAVVADFGIAHFGEDELLTAVETKDQERLANFTYAAPEQRARGERVDLRADIFALGLILNEMFTRTVPLAAGHPLIAEVAPNYAYLDEVVSEMIQHSPADRPSTVGKVKEDLLARGNEFIARQRLDAASRDVVPAFQPDDPLRGRDVKTTDLDWQGGFLMVGLEPEPPAAWWEEMRNLVHFSWSTTGLTPSNVGFANGKALVQVDPNLARQAFMSLSEWVDSTNKSYRERLRQEAERRQHEARLQLVRQREAAEERVRVLADLRKIPRT